MIKVFIPGDKGFNFKECKKLFYKHKRLIKDDQRFRDIVENTFFYSFFDDETFLGCIYYYNKDRKLFVNVFANRGHSDLNLKCFQMTFDWFVGDIYAKTQHKTAIYGLLRCGFKKIDKDLYKLERS